MQYLSTIVPQGQAVTPATGTAMVVATLDLSAGQWWVDGELWCNITSGTPTIATISGVLSAGAAVTGLSDPADNQAANVVEPAQAKQAGSVVGWVLPLTSMYVNNSGSQTVYLNGMIDWTNAGTILLYGKIAARGQPSAPAPGYAYVHATDGSMEGYVNIDLTEIVRPSPNGGAIVVIGNRALDVTETPDEILANART